MAKGYVGAFIAVGFFGMLLWWFATPLLYNTFVGYGMDAFQTGLIMLIVMIFWLGMFLYGFFGGK